MVVKEDHPLSDVLTLNEAYSLQTVLDALAYIKDKKLSQYQRTYKLMGKLSRKDIKDLYEKAIPSLKGLDQPLDSRLSDIQGLLGLLILRPVFSLSAEYQTALEESTFPKVRTP
jgi:hypothetical protein